MKTDLYIAAAPVANLTSSSSSFYTTPIVTNRISDFANLQRASDIDAARTQVEEALKLVGLLVPEYYSWIISVIYEIVALDSEFGNRSGSDCTIPGVICLSLPSKIDFVVEALVHEAAHQHFYKAEKNIGLFVEKECEVFGYSPIIKKIRPISKILLAYHALVNTLLLFLRSKKSNDYYGISTAHISWLEEVSYEFEIQLLAQSALTEFGIFFFQSIKHQKHLIIG
ncbi:HEXXH motif-containing protein [Rhodobium orientis]|uniref:HEXXH motif domain-containing protein n=1 Tax=Rhodobium orientis TaxID=34017 RepID=A0A327JJQ8_9HYPH|nr:HEXXH motif-containing putative peptide modification protein [Rhodobium orientis]MBB4305185.1 HEXXH motif-containing protein [Rhodobium orientis]MBK5949257.1 hypothetical protein [Rhodobium orientis]RAI26670.1 hypothetical protein CH339_13055 [Rhodobium orientis]